MTLDRILQTGMDSKVPGYHHSLEWGPHVALFFRRLLGSLALCSCCKSSMSSHTPKALRKSIVLFQSDGQRPIFPGLFLEHSTSTRGDESAPGSGMLRRSSVRGRGGWRSEVIPQCLVQLPLQCHIVHDECLFQHAEAFVEVGNLLGFQGTEALL